MKIVVSEFCLHSQVARHCSCVLLKDDLLSKLGAVTGQLSDVQLDRTQLSARLEQLHKVVQEVEEGAVISLVD